MKRGPGYDSPMRSLAALLGGVVLLAASCAPKPAPSTTPASNPAVGSSSWRVLADPDAAKPDLEEGEAFERPLPAARLALPEYPADALAAKAGAAVVAVRIFIGPDGTVVRVEDSPLLASSAGPFAASFRGAVDRTARSWRFRPGAITKSVDGTDVDGDGKPDYRVQTAWDPVTVYYDIRFDFSIVEGKGIVTTTGAPKDR